MKKKNVIGHMVAEKEAPANRFLRFHPISKILCLLIAVLIWLLVVNVTESRNGEAPDEPNLPITNMAEE